MYEIVYFDISGVCNAKCPWCITGNRSPKSDWPSGLVKVENFEKAIERLIDLKLVELSTTVNLFNWGEPLLHPEFGKLLKILSRRNVHFGISTNASRCVSVEHGSLTNMNHLIISMPGFSQTSYDRIHRLKFDQVLYNIDGLIDNFKKAGFQGSIILAYHIYQFNIGEIKSAMDFCSERKIEFSPSVAFIADFNLAKSYLDKSLSYETLQSISDDLLLYYIEDLIASVPRDYMCPEHKNILAIDEECNILTCCAIPKGHPDYSIGSIFNLSAEEIKKRKVSQSVCKECIRSGLAYWFHNPLVPSFINDIHSSRKQK